MSSIDYIKYERQHDNARLQINYKDDTKCVRFLNLIFTNDIITAQLADHITSLESLLTSALEANQVMRKALTKIICLEGTENNEWDAVERIIPEMSGLAKTAIAIQTKSNTE